MEQPKKSKSTATRQDSIAVRNSSLNFKKKMKQLNYQPTYSYEYDDKDPLNLYKFKDGKITVNNSNSLQESELKVTTNKRPNGDVYLNSNNNRRGGLVNGKKSIGYNVPLLKKENANQYSTIEQSAYLGYNTDLPSILMDARIKPQKQNNYTLHKTKTRTSDSTIFNEYDPIAVTPFDMLSDKEKKERVNKYGRDGVPSSYTGKSNSNNISNKPNPQVEEVNKLTPNDIKPLNNTIDSEVKINPQYIKPRSYKIKERRNVPYGLGDSNIDSTEYEVEDGNNIDTSKIKNRTITPVYANGGEIDPPIKSKGLTPQQQTEAEADAIWFNNWTANRVVDGKKLTRGYQIPNSQVVQSEPLVNPDGRPNDRGRFLSDTNTILLDPESYDEAGIPAHEYNHRRQKYMKQQNPTGYNNYIKKPIESLVPNIDTYSTEPDEIHSDLMRLRRNADFKPDQVITPEDVKDVDFDYYNFSGVKNKDNLIKLLNTTADASTPSTIPYAAYGGNINTNSNTMNRTSRLPRNKRHIAPSALVGTAGSVASLVPGIGTAVGVGLNLASGIMAGNEADAEERKRQDMIRAQQAQQDGIALQNYNTVGNAGVQYYAQGGNLLPSSIKGKYQATGGDLTSLNSTTEVAEGNTHGEKTIDGQYGITLSNGQKPIAEVEDQEVIVNNNQVYSDRLMYDKSSSYADKAKQIAKKAGRLETKLNKTTDTKSRNGYERALAGTKMAEEALFKHQEQTKFNEGMQEINNLPNTAVMARGGLLGEGTLTDSQLANNIGNFYPNQNTDEEDPTFAEQLAPGLIDNIGNMIIAGNTPKIPTPMYNKAPILETSVNVNPQLSAINDSVNTTTDMLLSNTNNSNVARSNIAANRLGGLRAKLGLFGEKENTERGLRNDNVLRQSQVAASNNALTDNYNMNNFTRTGDMQARQSANLGNLSEDIDKVFERRDLKDYYDTVQLADVLDDPTGEKIRTANRNPELYKSAKTRAAIKKEAERRRSRTPYNYNNIIQSAI